MLQCSSFLGSCGLSGLERLDKLSPKFEFMKGLRPKSSGYHKGFLRGLAGSTGLHVRFVQLKLCKCLESTRISFLPEVGSKEGAQLLGSGIRRNKRLNTKASRKVSSTDLAGRNQQQDNQECLIDHAQAGYSKTPTSCHAV